MTYNSGIKARNDYYATIAYAEEKARLKGKLEAELEGEIEGKLEIARKMKIEGFPLEQIAKLTGLPADQISQIEV